MARPFNTEMRSLSKTQSQVSEFAVATCSHYTLFINFHACSFMLVSPPQKSNINQKNEQKKKKKKKRCGKMLVLISPGTKS